MVTEMIEDPLNKCLVVAVSDSKGASDIEVYELATEFKLVRRIGFKEISEEVGKRTGAKMGW
jgi:hypothetical protein